MRVTMTQAWDRASEVLAGRQAVLAPIAIATLWLPGVVRQGVAALLMGDAATSSPAASGAAMLVGLIGIVAAIVGLWGKLAIVAVASDPATTAGEGLRAGLARLSLMIGLTVLILLAVMVLAIPLGVIVAPIATRMTSYDPAAMMAPMNLIPAGQRLFFSLYVLILAIAFMWLVVRLVGLSPVVVNERAGLASFRRSFQITHHHFWRLLGVLVLFGIVIGIASIAVQSVVGIIARLVIGAHPGLVAFVTVLFTAAIAAIGNVVVLVFTTQFYFLRREATPLP